MGVILLITTYYPTIYGTRIPYSIRITGTNIFVRLPFFDHADTLADAYSIILASFTAIATMEFSLEEIGLKTKSNKHGAMILLKLGVPLELSSRYGSISSTEQSRVFPEL